MLARAADTMFWLARYMERMDAVARLLDAASHMSALSADASEWRSAIIAAGSEHAFAQKYAIATPEAATHFLAADHDNPSSILSCLEQARANARSMRIALTRDMWDAVNEAWLESKALGPEHFSQARLPDTLDWVKRTATRFRGAYAGTMLRNDVYWFTRLGTFIERADNTARILDVKYHVLLPSYSGVGGMLDYYQWTSILQAVSAVRAYRVVYHGQITPWNVADLLILRSEMPRSLRTCYEDISENLERIAEAYGGARGECHRLAGEVHAKLRYGKIEGIFQQGLHEFLTSMIDQTSQVGNEIANFYLR
jgi:uncharacterized alpha-E superfamily protein